MPEIPYTPEEDDLNTVDNDTMMSPIQELAENNRMLIAATVAYAYGLEVDDLDVLSDLSFWLPDKPNNVYFRVLHEKSNTMYGVIAERMEDGSINNYRCGIIAL